MRTCLVLICCAVTASGCGGGGSAGDVQSKDIGDVADSDSIDNPGSIDTPAADDHQDQGVADSDPLDPGGESGISDAASDPVGDTNQGDGVPPVDTAGNTDVPDAFVPHPDPKTVPLFQADAVLDFSLDFTPDQWALYQLTITKGIKDYAHCNLTFGTNSFVDAACRPKGNPTSWADQKKPQFVVRFNHWDANGRFMGLRAINLEYSPYHFAPIRDRLGLEFMAAAGVVSSRVSHVRLSVSGQDYGLYQNIEVVDHEFLEDNFVDPSGNLYEQGNKLITNEAINDLTRIWDLEDLVDGEPLTGDHTSFFASLAQLTDMHQILREMAAEAVLPTGDNFINGGSNFFWYDQPGRGFLLIPWDLDDVFSEWARTDSDFWAYWGEPGTGLPPCKFWQLVQQNPVWNSEFLASVRELRDGPFQAVKTRVADVCAMIRPIHETDAYREGDMQEFDADCTDMVARIDARTVFLRQAAP